MSEYRVNIDVFAGPLDLLLYLVQKDEVDVYDIPIAKVTAQYVKYIELMKDLDINLAGSFLVMAATLMHIKSAMLLPKVDDELDGQNDLIDPRSELVTQLLEYKKYKDAANLLDDAAKQQQKRHRRYFSIADKIEPDTEPKLDLDQVNVWNLLEAFDQIMQSIGDVPDISHIEDETPIDLYQIDILQRLQSAGPVTFERIFGQAKTKLVAVGMFLALLELVKDGLVSAIQDEPKSPLYLKSLTEDDPVEAVQKTIMQAKKDFEIADNQQEKNMADDDNVPDVTGAKNADEGAAKPAIEIVEIPAQKKRAYASEKTTSLK